MQEIITLPYNGKNPMNKQYFIINLVYMIGVENSQYFRVLSKRIKQIYDIYYKTSINKDIPNDFTFIETIITSNHDNIFDILNNRY